jgi:hypothetical protein
VAGDHKNTCRPAIRPAGGDPLGNVKNVTIDPVFTIEKRCDRCRNVLYFSDTVITDVVIDADGRIVRSSIVCPVCGNVILLYSIEEPPRADAALKIIGDGEEDPSPGQA